jgi:small subunit ribosomal protein S5
MTEVAEKKEQTTPKTEATTSNETSNKPASNAGNAENQGERRVFKKNRRKNNRRRERQRSEFDQKILGIRRVTRVAAGGRRFSFSVTIAIGDKKGRVGIGVGKAGDTALAIEKATREAKKNLITVKMTENNSIPHEVKSKYCSAQVMMMPAKGRGIIAGSVLRDIIDLTGLNDINAKIISGTKNQLNIGRATIKALESLKTPRNPKKAPAKKVANKK